ncbi:MAG: hypothetical protein ACPG5T_05760, partial [Endozoicomonas sp.]
MNNIYLKINVTTGIIKDFSGNLITEPIEVVNKDFNLFVAKFVESAGTSETDLNMATITSCRLVCDEELAEDAERLFFQDSFNQNESPENEDLSAGAVTHALFINDPAIDAFMGSESEKVAVMEYSIVDSQSRPITLTKGGIPIKIIAGVDNGEEGVPPEQTPSYYTAIEIDARVAK